MSYDEQEVKIYNFFVIWQRNLRVTWAYKYKMKKSYTCEYKYIYMNMLTRSSEIILNPMRCTDNYNGEILLSK